ncbi:hypothetical protein [Nocardia salmonicida]|uniref:hypothetical protein n=1 Tax=Nocardia salmonicida TaxID=53431 RepID=UPI0012F49DF1|nr:hypothetical protein [Nocardia salmonicida]MBC7299537.1 hypothetical protein [Nocardia sp.]
MTTLRELLQRAADRGLSTRAMEAAVERVATTSGTRMRLNRGTASQILSGKYKSKPSDSTIRAIAHLAGVPDLVAFAAADQPAPDTLAFRAEIPSEADKLSPRRRRIAIDVIRSLIEAQQLEHQLAEGIRITASMSPDEARAAMYRVAEIFPGLVEVVEHRSGGRDVVLGFDR